MADELEQSVDPITAVKDVALGEMAKSEDATDFIRERQARDAEERGEQVNGDDRTVRIRQALQRAQQDTAEARQAAGLNGEQPPDLNAQYWDAENEWQQEQLAEQEAEQQRTIDRDEARFQGRAEVLRQQNPALWQQMTDFMAGFDRAGMSEEQINALKRGLTMGSDGLDIAYRLSQPSYNADGSINSPEDKIAQIAAMSPQEILQNFRDCRVFIQAEQAAFNRFNAMGRRHTKAPPPFRTPRGGAAPPKDLHQLASKGENVGDYIKARQAQEKRRES
jgi:hypothetical protein